MRFSKTNIANVPLFETCLYHFSNTGHLPLKLDSYTITASWHHTHSAILALSKGNQAVAERSSKSWGQRCGRLLFCKVKHAIAQTVVLLVKSDAMTLTWRQSTPNRWVNLINLIKTDSSVTRPVEGNAYICCKTVSLSVYDVSKMILYPHIWLKSYIRRCLIMDEKHSQ